MLRAMPDQSLPEALGRHLLRTSLPRLTRLEEGDDFPVDIGKPLDEDQVTGVVEDAQFGVRDRFGQSGGVGDGHVAV